MSLYLVTHCFLIPLAAVVTYYDVRYRRIPNPFVLAALVSGVAINSILADCPGLYSSLSGCGLAFIFMFMLHVFGAMGAGDVKLFAAIGAVIGAQLVLPTFVVVVLTGGLLAVVSIMRVGDGHDHDAPSFPDLRRPVTGMADAKICCAHRPQIHHSLRRCNHHRQHYFNSYFSRLTRA